MEIQQETMGFDNGDSEQDAITKMNEEQCQQAICKLEYYAEKFEKYVEALRKIDDHRRNSGDNRTLKSLFDYNLDFLCNENYFFSHKLKRLSNTEVLEILLTGIRNNGHLEKYILFFCIASNYLVAMYEILYDRTDFRYSQAFLYKAVKKFKSNKYKDQVEIAANRIHAAKQIFKEIWPSKEMDNFINLRRVPEDLAINRPYATSQNWTDKMYISEYRKVRFFHKLDGLKLNSKALFQQFNRISKIFEDEAVQRFADAKRRKEEKQLREAQERRRRLDERNAREAANKGRPTDSRKRKLQKEDQQSRPTPRKHQTSSKRQEHEEHEQEEEDDAEEPQEQKEEEGQQSRPTPRKHRTSSKRRGGGGRICR